MVLGEIGKRPENFTLPASEGRAVDWPLLPLPAGPLFRLYLQPPSQNSSLGATVGSETRYVLVDQSGADRSGRVIQVLTELIALNNSARDLPAPSVVPVITR